ncbi:MAG: hypothetical protein E6G22_05015 [Actinobacteria bacterium]|nr:MAG: hypothetical protein E6G22_05015 [Actinomycetota bacterium]
MGQPVETLDLLRPSLRAVCVGINPAPKSVAAGHYYQGPLGRQFFERLRCASVIAEEAGWDDDRAFANGIGFTDIVKRPTSNANELQPIEFEHGEALLRQKLERLRPARVVFTFKKVAERLFGKFAGCGRLAQFKLGSAPVFVMPRRLRDATKSPSS